MFFKLTRILFLLFSAATMLRFALPKLQAMPVSVQSFRMFSQVLSIDANIFMYFTGFVELLIVLMLITSLFIRRIQIKNLIQIMAYLLLLATMIGSILIEQFVRITPVSFLMTTALVLITICISELSILTKQKE